MNPTLAQLVEAIQTAPAHCGGTRVVLIDGPAGSGKTTLAGRIGAELGGAQVLHADDMYEGWSGLPDLGAVLIGQVLAPLAAGEQAGFRRWDWAADARAERIDVPAAPYLVIEGVGVAQRAARPYAAWVIYVEAPWELRRERGISRDGEGMLAEWERWQAAEETFLDGEGTRASADAVVDGTAVIA